MQEGRAQHPEAVLILILGFNFLISDTCTVHDTTFFIMPREKRIKNPLKFVDERENNNASRSLQPPAPAASEDTTNVEASETPSQAAANSISSDGATRCSNSKSSSAWNVEIIGINLYCITSVEATDSQY
ncbi:hypothetical protein S245_042843 [Arachis hypogaea]